MPCQILSLDLACQIYLYREIQEFCTPETRDLTCPKPDGYLAPGNALDNNNNELNDNDHGDEPINGTNGNKRKATKGKGKTAAKKKR
jgi:hypothetical protein